MVSFVDEIHIKEYNYNVGGAKVTSLEEREWD